MVDFTVYDETSAPDASRELLATAKRNYGLVPGVLGVLAANAAALEAYMTVSGIFANAGFDKTEQQVVLITSAVENECHFCVAAHTAVSAGQKLDMDVINAVREDRPIADPKLEALHRFTKQVVVQRGFVSDADVQAFIDAGYTRSAVLGVILGVSLKAISNYTNHVAETPVNEPFQAFAWTPRARDAAAAE